MTMTSDEANLWISAIVGDALTLARAIGISELDIVAGFSPALLDWPRQASSNRRCM